MPFSQKQLERLLAVSQYYYQDNLSQLDIAQRLGLSRPTVAKALQQAREAGIVTIQIHDPFADRVQLATTLKEKYQLKDVVVAQQTPYEESDVRDQLGAETADYLDRIVTDEMTLGLNWGRTLRAVARHLHASQARNVQLVQLKGSLTSSAESNFSAEITHAFNQAFHTQAQLLPLPLIFEDARVKQAALRDPAIQRVIQAGERADVALYTVGTMQPDTLLFHSGYLTTAQITALQRVAVGDILSHYLTATGTLADPALDQRTVALPVDRLADRQYAILVAGGQDKLTAIHAALLGRYANVLIVDQAVAKRLIALPTD